MTSSAVSVRQEAKPFSSSISLSLRVALLESLVAGRSELLGSGASSSSSDVTRAPKSSEQSILIRTIQAQERLDEALKPHRPISQFAADYAHHRPYLVPSFGNAKSSQSPRENNPDATESDGQGNERHTTLTPQAQMTLLLEADQDLRDLERDLRQCQTYEERGVAGAGTLAEHEALVTKIEGVKETASKRSYNDKVAEEQVMTLVEEYSQYVETISQLFIHWDHALNELELQVGALERRKA